MPPFTVATYRTVPFAGAPPITLTVAYGSSTMALTSALISAGVGAVPLGGTTTAIGIGTDGVRIGSVAGTLLQIKINISIGSVVQINGLTIAGTASNMSNHIEHFIVKNLPVHFR